MLFEQESEALRWYESEERVLTKTFLDSIPWQDVAKHSLNEKFIPVLLYMRDVEKFTDLYYHQMIATPTGKDPVIRPFMDRWSTEEPVHGELLNRFLNEAGHPTSERWYEEALAKIPRSFRFGQWKAHLAATTVGKAFSAVHMTWGAINELTTLNGYQRLWELAGHPVLEYILRAIAREEARHTFFYWSMARIKLLKSSARQSLTRFIVKHFWAPVGQGAKLATETNMMIRTLFPGEEGVKFMDQRVSQRIEQLPGLQGLKTVTERIAQISRELVPGMTSEQATSR